jgi:phosphatidylserine decarboxylase
MTIHKEGYPTLLIGLVVLSIINISIYYFLGSFSTIFLILSVSFYLFLVSFFRKPNRDVVSVDNNILLSPCDGKVVVIEKVYEPEFLQSECMQVSIFMSPLNVHINWFPTDALVTYSKYHPGKYLAAWNPKASTENERTTVCYDIYGKQVLLRQVAGALARRIVCYATAGKSYRQGDEMGFIKFGSRVDLYLPLDTDIQVKMGDVVEGNRSTIGKLKS